MQARLVRGSPFVHETFGAYKTVEELWDGELWADTESLHNYLVDIPNDSSVLIQLLLKSQYSTINRQS